LSVTAWRPRGPGTCARAACTSLHDVVALPPTLSIATSSGPKSRTLNFHSDRVEVVEVDVLDLLDPRRLGAPPRHR
jgi:hypothetical protein